MVKSTPLKLSNNSLFNRNIPFKYNVLRPWKPDWPSEILLVLDIKIQSSSHPISWLECWRKVADHWWPVSLKMLSLCPDSRLIESSQLVFFYGSRGGNYRLLLEEIELNRCNMASSSMCNKDWGIGFHNSTYLPKISSIINHRQPSRSWQCEDVVQVLTMIWEILL